MRSSRLYASNFELSLARSNAVADMMRPFLDDPNRLRPEGRGEADPIADNGTKEGRALNRRIELMLLSNVGGTE